MKDQKGATFIGQLYDIKTKRDGGGRMSIDFGADGLEEVQWIQKVAAARGCSFQIALVPTPNGRDGFIPEPNMDGIVEL